MANFSRDKLSGTRALMCAGWLAVTAAAHSAESLIWTNRVAVATNDPLPALLQQQREAIQQTIEELRQEVSASSKEVIERTAREADTLSTKVNETLKQRLELIERSLAQRQEHELAALRDSNETFFKIALLFAGLGFLAIIIAAAILARAINRFSELAMSISSGNALGRGPEHAALGAGDLHGIAPAQFEQASARFAEAMTRLELRSEQVKDEAAGSARLAEAMTRLEQRIKELENSFHPTLDADGSADPGGADHIISAKLGSAEETGVSLAHAKLPHNAATVTESSRAEEHRSEVSVLLGKGQSLLNLGQNDEAVECFNKAIALDPKNADTFVKKGLALERMQKMEEAIDSYDRAIALNDSFTLAYLYKGAVCNKLQRFREALDCYEKALRTEQKSVAA